MIEKRESGKRIRSGKKIWLVSERSVFWKDLKDQYQDFLDRKAENVKNWYRLILSRITGQCRGH